MDKPADPSHWSAEAVRGLLGALADPTAIWAGMPTCEVCGRPLAGADCDWPDLELCFSAVHIDLLLPLTGDGLPVSRLVGWGDMAKKRECP